MKKILSLALAAAMVMSALPVAYAAENETDYTNGTQISYMGTQEVDNGGAGDVWTVTVPAKMVPGDTGTVKAEGTWGADKYLRVSAPTSVTLSYGAQSMDVNITFDTMYKIGNSVKAVSAEHDIAIEEASRLFGTWEGVIVYQVKLIQKGDVNKDGVIDALDLDKMLEYSDNWTTEDSIYADMDDDGMVNYMDIFEMTSLLEQNGLLPEE